MNFCVKMSSIFSEIQDVKLLKQSNSDLMKRTFIIVAKLKITKHDSRFLRNDICKLLKLLFINKKYGGNWVKISSTFRCRIQIRIWKKLAEITLNKSVELYDAYINDTEDHFKVGKHK